MPTYFSAAGNPEIWAVKPDGYMTEDEWQATLPVSAASTLTTDQQMAALRTERDALLIATDKYMLADYPLSADNLASVKAYRVALRYLPAQPGAPWDGGGDETPWPELPTV